MSPEGSFKVNERRRELLVESLLKNAERFLFRANLSLGASALLLGIALAVFCAPESFYEDVISSYVSQQRKIETTATKERKENEIEMARRARLETPAPPAATPKPEASPR
jgi:hypothetical protein